MSALNKFEFHICLHYNLPYKCISFPLRLQCMSHVNMSLIGIFLFRTASLHTLLYKHSAICYLLHNLTYRLCIFLHSYMNWVGKVLLHIMVLCILACIRRLVLHSYWCIYPHFCIHVLVVCIFLCCSLSRRILLCKYISLLYIFPHSYNPYHLKSPLDLFKKFKISFNVFIR
jgi:hypothetical protein